MLNEGRSQAFTFRILTDHERPQEGIGAIQLKTDEPRGRTAGAHEEEVLQMPIGDIRDGQPLRLEQRNGGSSGRSSADHKRLGHDL
jgi:hypothetical protein